MPEGAMTTKKPTVLVVTADRGRIIIAVGPNCWGQGDRSDIALKNARKNLPDFSDKKFKEAARYAVYDCSEDTYVNDMGRLSYLPADGKPVLVYEDIR
jgi:hypothetical protein